MTPEMVEAVTVLSLAGAGYLIVIGLILATVFGYAKARTWLIGLQQLVRALEPFADEPTDQAVVAFVGLARTMGLRIDPEEASKLLPMLTRWMGEAIAPNGESHVVSKAD